MGKHAAPRLHRDPKAYPHPKLDTPRVEAILCALDRHGEMDTFHIHKLIDHIPGAENLKQTTQVLKQLYHHGFIDHPETCNIQGFVNSRITRRLTDKGWAVIDAKGLAQQYAVKPSGGDAHSALITYTTSSIEIAAKKHGVRFISQEEILKNAPARTEEYPLAIPAEIDEKFTFEGKKYEWKSDKPLVPDSLFGLDFGTKGKMYFALEADRGNMPGVRKKLIGQNNLLAKILKYRHIVRNRTCLSYWGVPSLMVMFVTTAQNKQERFAELIESFVKLPQRMGGGSGATYFVMNHVSLINQYHVPPVWFHLFEKEWQRAGLPPATLEQCLL